MKILAMSLNRGTALKHVGNLAPKIAEHIIKVFLFPHCTYTKGWLKELNAWYSSVADTGSNIKKGKKLNADDYFDILIRPLMGEGLKKIYKGVIVGNPELKLERFPIRDLHVLDSMTTGLYLHLANCLEDDEPWEHFAGTLRNYTHTEIK